MHRELQEIKTFSPPTRDNKKCKQSFNYALNMETGASRDEINYEVIALGRQLIRRMFFNCLCYV